MADTIEVDSKRFHKHTKFFLSQWKSAANDDLFQNVDAILVMLGDDDQENPYTKSATLMTWLVGIPFHQTLILLTPDKLTFVCSNKKANLLDVLKDGAVDVEVIRRGKNQEDNIPLYKPLVELIAGKRVGVFAKDKDAFSGKNISEWQSALGDQKFEDFDVTPALAACLAVKDDEELRSMRLAAKSTSNMMTHYFTKEMSTLIDAGKTITHEKLSEKTEEVLDDPKLQKIIRLPSEISDAGDLDWCYTPIVQSGGNYVLKPTALSDNKPLHSGVIVCSLGLRYKFYCSNIARTFLIDPTKQQQRNYEFLCDLQQRVMEAIRDGAKIKEVYARAQSYVQQKRPDLANHLVKNAGCGMGIEFRETTYALTQKNMKEIKAGMVFNLALGFENLENKDASDPKAKIYALYLVDTVRVTNDLPVVLTDSTKRLGDISFFFGDDNADEQEVKDEMDIDDDDDVVETKKKKANKGKARRDDSAAAAAPTTRQQKSAVLRSKFRSEEMDDDSKEQKRNEHQKALFAQKQADGLAKFSDNGPTDKQEDKVTFKRFESYRSEQKLPHGIHQRQIIVDKRNESIILPVNQMAVPFHISTLKTASKSDEGEYVMLRLNFITPGQAGNKKEDLPFDDPNATFIRALTFRSANATHMAEVYRSITDLKKEAVKKETERKEMADVVEQDSLVMVRGKRPTRLPDVYVRPQLDGKRLPGELEIHTNGLRYSTLRSDQTFNILFSNIKHLFFQPCDNELLVLVHIHLKNPVVIGKKKTKDIQFYREASDIQFDDTGNKRRRHIYGDDDEIESEREERRRRKALNQEFKTFAEKIAEGSDDRIEVDIPFRELGFQGVPFRTNVLLQPTTDCLVHLSDQPFMVVTLNEIEIAHLERVQFGLKNFDMVFVFKDFQRAPIHINTIPMTQLDNVKDWLDSVEVVFTEGPVNLNWTMIMKTVNENPAEFFRSGGWSFLSSQSDNEDSGEESEAESEFEMSEDDFEESESDDESDFGGGSASEESEPEELSDEGEDWDEMEEQARKADERKTTKRGNESAAASSSNKRKKVRR
ncbi:FACT complex subunit-domain-containing protein [Gongronella butleri]|nr:FACT complex subunit-domain-containing protein [Gongronella butleri]